MTLLTLHVVQVAEHTAFIHAVETANGRKKKEMLSAPSGTKGASRKHPMLNETFNTSAARGVPASRNAERPAASHKVAADTAGTTIIHSALKKAELIKECHKRGIDTTTHETRASMMRKIRNQVEMEAGGTGISLMGMGKHSDRSYQEVKDDDPNYVRWAKETVQEEGMKAHWKLRKFVAWIRAQENSDDELVKETVPSPAEAAANWIAEQLDGGRSRPEAIAEAVKNLPSGEDAAELFEILSR